MEAIYLRHRRGTPSFEGTLVLLQDLVGSRLMPGFRRVWVQGTNSGRSTLLFTIFEDGRDYRMEFMPIGLRQFRPNVSTDAEFEMEMVLIEEVMERLRTGPLSGVITDRI